MCQFSPDFKRGEIHFNDEDSDSISISFFPEVGAITVMVRPKKALLEKTLERIFRKVIAKRRAKENKLQSCTFGVDWSLVLENSIIDRKILDVILNDEVVDNMIFKAGSIQFILKRNPTAVLSLLTFPKKASYPGFILLSSAECSYFDGVDYTWCSVKDSGENHILSIERLYNPRVSDIGHEIKLFVSPWRYQQSSVTDVNICSYRDDNAENYRTENNIKSLNCATLENISKIYGRTVTHYCQKVLYPEKATSSIIEFRSPPSLIRATEQTIDEPIPIIRSTNNRDIILDKSHIISNDMFGVWMAERGIPPCDCSTVRVVSYNVLSDMYTSREDSQKDLYSYLDKKYLDLDYRAPLVLNELIFYRADIIHLQECDEKVYQLYYEPYFSNLSYYSNFIGKDGPGLKEGCASFVNRKLFDVRHNYAFLLKEVV